LDEVAKGMQTLCGESTSCDAVRDFLQAGVHVQHFGWCCLRNCQSEFDALLDGDANLGVLATFEERCDAYESDVVVPHHGVLLVVSRDFEYVLKDCTGN
jgi:hypothetical protein